MTISYMEFNNAMNNGTKGCLLPALAKAHNSIYTIKDEIAKLERELADTKEWESELESKIDSIKEESL